MRELPVSTKSLRRQLSDLLTAVILTSAKLAAQEEQTDQEYLLQEIPENVRKVKELVDSPAYRHAQNAYVEGVITLIDLARALEPLRQMLPWLVITQHDQKRG